MSEKNKMYEKAICEALVELISKAKGTCVSFESIDIAKLAGLPINAYTLYSIKKILYKLMRAGIVRRLKRRKGRIFVVDCESPLWSACKIKDKELVFEIISECIKSRS